MIHSKIRDLRLAIGSVKAEKTGGVLFPVRGAKQLFQKLAQACTDHDVVVSVIAQEIHYEDTSKIPSNQTASGKPVFRTLVHVKATVRCIAPDGSYIDFVGSGHGGDVDDKAGGKASTYAAKDALFKGLMIPDADVIDTDDEQPSEPKPRGKAAKEPEKTTDSDSTQVPRFPTSGLEVAVAAIAAAESLADLEAVAADIKSEKIKLAGSDKLRATTAYVARKKALSV
jgi:hypothetical protein